MLLKKQEEEVKRLDMVSCLFLQNNLCKIIQKKVCGNFTVLW